MTPFLRFPIAAVVLATAAFGIFQFGSGAWIFAKAELAQVLLDHAWSNTRQGQTMPPWPWADVTPVAAVAVPRLGEHAIVLSDMSGEALAFGPGLVSGPGSLNTDVEKVIAAHRDTHFAFLRYVRPGDKVVLETARGPQRHYLVTSGEVIDVRTYRFVPGDRDTLTLITCWPFDALTRGPLRLVLRAERIEETVWDNQHEGTASAG